MPNLFPATHLDWSPDIAATIDKLLAGIPGNALQGATAALQDLYRGVRGPAALGAVNTQHMALAYLAARLPTTYQTIAHVLSQLPDDFTPATLLDLGAGPGTASLAATGLYPDITPTLVEREATFTALARQLLPQADIINANLLTADLTSADLVTLGYVVNELAPHDIAALMARAWAATRDYLVIIETGTPHGYGQLMLARKALLQAGAQIVAPCPHHLACPLQGKDWCHFAVRVERGAQQRNAKGATLPYEDEKFCYLIACRAPVAHDADRAAPGEAATLRSRVIKAPHRAGGHVVLDLCTQDGASKTATISKRDGARYKAARQLMWGDALND